MTNDRSKWLDLIWRALAEDDPVRKDQLLQRAHFVIERQTRDSKAVPSAA